MPWIWKFVGALTMSGIAMAETHFRVAIDGEPLVAADIYLYTGPDQRAWIASVADGATDIPQDVVAATLLDTKGNWQWVIETSDELVYASTSQSTPPHDWRAALAGMGDAAQTDAFINLPAPIELDVTVVRADGHPAAHAYGSIERVFDHAGPCGQARALSPMRLGISASPNGRIGWRLAPGRYELLVDGVRHAIELADDKDPQRLASLRIELTEQRPSFTCARKLPMARSGRRDDPLRRRVPIAQLRQHRRRWPLVDHSPRNRRCRFGAERMERRWQAAENPARRHRNCGMA
jgi:hypothetical protein